MPTFKKNTSPAMKRSGFKMKGYTYPGTSPLRDEKDKDKVKAEKEALIEGVKRDAMKVAHEESLVKSDAMKNLEANKPAKDSTKYASWKKAYDKAAAKQKAEHAQ